MSAEKYVQYAADMSGTAKERVANPLRVAIITSGQGVAGVNLLESAAELQALNEEVFFKHLNLGQEAHARHIGFGGVPVDFRELLKNPDHPELKLTRTVQPFTLALILANAEIAGPELDTYAEEVVGAGHSLGEWGAAARAGFMPIELCYDVVALRGASMGALAAKHPGKMYAPIGIQEDELDNVVNQIEGVAYTLFNSPGGGKVVGVPKVVDAEFNALAKERGAVKITPVSDAMYHMEYLKPSAEMVRDRLARAQVKDGKYPLALNLTGEVTNSARRFVECATEVIYKPVRWDRCMEGVKSMAEAVVLMGPRTPLSSLVTRNGVDKSVVIPYSQLQTLHGTLRSPQAPQQ